MKPYNVVNTLEDLIDLYWDDPAAFAVDMLDFKPDEWQENVLHDMARNRFVSVRSGQGVGKTGLEAVVCLWFLCTRPFPKVVCTAPTMHQLHDVLWAEISKWLTESKVSNLLKWTKTRVYMLGNQERWFATARTATKPENMQGFHEDYMLFIVDEASGVADPILESILGTLSGEENKLLMCANPTQTSGIFYDSHNKMRSRFKTHKVSSVDSNRTSKENIEMLLEKYGRDSDVARIRIFGEFPRGESDAFIPLEIAEYAKDSTLEIDKNITIGDIGVDIARFGDDETVISPRVGSKAFELTGYRNKETTETTGIVLRHAAEMLKEHPHLEKIYIKVDDSGVGGGVTDQLKERIHEQNLPYRVFPVINNSKANDDEYYENVGTEQWGVLREMLQESFTAYMQGKEPLIDLPNDDTLISQLSTRKYKITSRGKIVLERKDDMKKRGLDSPDRADAIVLSFYRPIFNIGPVNVAI
jgi:phage terminase large subunit